MNFDDLSRTMTVSSTPTSEEVLAALSAILESSDFPATQRNRQFLEFIVRSELAGEEITAHRVACQIFGRPENFSTITDPIVRIEAGRLRRDLETYYLKSGRASDLRIDLPRGGYRPFFRRVETTSGHDGVVCAELPADPSSELERVLSSTDFPASERNRRFLRFLVERSLAGDERISAWEVGTEIFGRPRNFQPNIDPVVRIEAGRLRRDLETYYLKEGCRNPLRFEIPKGGYRVAFVAAEKSN